jgi:hypothetical protein
MESDRGVMDEQAARDVLLMKAIETTDHARQVLSDDDRMYASRSARDLAQWAAAEKKQSMTPELFLQKRAAQILAKIAERIPAAEGYIRIRPWMRVASVLSPTLAFLCGALADRIGDPHHVDLLSAPLLLMLIWNLLVYAGLLLWPLFPAPARPRAFLATVAGLARPAVLRPRRPPQLLATALARFSQEWLSLAAPLSAARAKRILHLCAACLALGAVVSLYLRGILAQYRAGWESTFLDAHQVHWLLSILVQPAISLFGLQGFSLEQIQALQFPQAAAPASGAQWVHLYAATLLLLVILPRLVLAMAARWKERRLAARFPVDLGQPYFRRLCTGLDAAAGVVLRACPYSYSVDERRRAGLAQVAHSLLGDRASLALAPSAAYGEDPSLPPTDANAALTVALFSLSATPEQENHGVFLDRLKRQSARGFIALIDESGYLERLGGQADSRAAERMALWRRFCAQHQTPAAVVNLLAPQSRIDEIERLLDTGNVAP